MLLAVGVALAVGGYPWDDGSPWSRALKAFLLSDVGLSMRSLPRAVPLVALGLAVLLGAGVTSVTRRWPKRSPGSRPRRWSSSPCMALPPLWMGRFVPENLRRPEAIPDYWNEAAEHLDAQGDATRVLVVPGTDFASYRWGNTVDPVLPGLMDRPSVQRELIPYGSPASANLLNAFDLGLQERTADPPQPRRPSPASCGPATCSCRATSSTSGTTPRGPRNFWQFVTGAPGLGHAHRIRPGGAEPHRPRTSSSRTS